MRRTITINGVDINEYQKKLEALNNKKTTQNNKKKSQKKETKTKKTQANNTTLQKITTFFNKNNAPSIKEDRTIPAKQEDDNNLNLKKTFKNIKENNKVQQLSKGEKC